MDCVSNDWLSLQLPVPDKKPNRAGGSASASGCQGAHFLPTVHRQGPTPSLTKARSVPEHVPSLCQSSAGSQSLLHLNL